MVAELRLEGVDGEREAEVLRAGADEGADREDGAPLVDQRAAAVARVHRGVGLQVGHAVDAPVGGGDDPARERVAQAERVPDREDGLPRMRGAAVAEGEGAAADALARDHEGEVARHVGEDDLAARDAAVRRAELDEGRVPDDVRVRHDEPRVARDPAGAVPRAGADPHDPRAEALEEGAHWASLPSRWRKRATARIGGSSVASS